MPVELQSFVSDPDGTSRSPGHAVVAWWVGNWANAKALHTHEQLQSLAAMIDKLVAARE